MKITFATLLILTALMSCTTSKQKKAETLVKSYLDSTSLYPKSYESIEFEKLDTLRQSILDNPEYILMQNKADSLKEIGRELSREVDSLKTLAELNTNAEKDKVLVEKQAVLTTAINEYILKFKGKPVGWVLKHTYKVKNAVGDLKITTQTFKINNDLTKILGTDYIQ